MPPINLLLFRVALLQFFLTATAGFTSLFPRGGRRLITFVHHASSSSPSSSSLSEATSIINWDKVTNEWELDCYSRPVLVEGKKKLVSSSVLYFVVSLFISMVYTN